MPHLQSLDGVSFELKSPFDLSFLRRYGRAFRVFDDQDSGNLCFGMDDGRERRFVKFAGAPTLRGCVSAEVAIENLKHACTVYRALKHPALIELLDTLETGDGFAAVFRWTDAVCMGKQYPQSRERFFSLSVDERLKVFADIQDFFIHTAAQGYVAVDFYDGSILYDFAERRTLLCDVDLFQPAPYRNAMGRMWGSTRFMSPEEFALGSVIDEVTNVYTLGATAFALFSDSDRAPERWPLSRRLFDVAVRATSPERSQRPSSLRAFADEWRAAL